MDQARDMLDIRSIVVEKNLTLIGPTTSINGVFLGPSYYYFNVLPFALGGGDPSALVYWNILMFILGAVLIFWFFSRRNLWVGAIASIIFLMSPALFMTSRYFWNSNVMPYMTIIYFIALLYYIEKPSIKRSLLIGFIAGIGMHFQAAFGILFFPFALISALAKKVDKKQYLYLLAGFFVTLLPQILFDLRHNFVMAKIFFAEASGEGSVLGDRLSYPKALLSHAKTYLEFMEGLFILPQYGGPIVVFLSILFLAYKTRIKNIHKFSKVVFFVSLGFLVFSFLFYAIYPYALKGWFILGLRIPIIFIVACFMYELFETFKGKTKYLVLTLIALFFSYSFILTYQDQSQFIPKSISERSKDKSNLRNEIESIDWVYKHTEGKGFKAYNYIPSVYDFPYQYLYWWHGTKKYGYQPEVVSYLDNVPEYIVDNQKFFTKTKPQEDGLIALIYETDEIPDRMYGWLGNFTKYCPVTDIKYTWGAIAEIRKPCLPGEKP